MKQIGDRELAHLQIPLKYASNPLVRHLSLCKDQLVGIIHQSPYLRRYRPVKDSNLKHFKSMEKVVNDT